MLIGLRTQRILMTMAFLLMKMMIRLFLQSLSTVALLLEQGRKFFRNLASMLRELHF
jgi:hypothetical protein